MARYKKLEREKVRSETRQMLLDAASAEFAGEGYAGANINRISLSAGFAKGTIYNYFPSKRMLMIALIDEIAKAHLEFVVGQVQEEAGAEDRLARFFEAGFGFVTTHVAQARVLINNIYGPDTEFKEQMYQAYQPMFEFVATEIIALGIDEQVFRVVDPVATTVLLMTIYLGTASQVNDEGQAFLNPGQVSEFALHALRLAERPEHSER